MDRFNGINIGELSPHERQKILMFFIPNLSSFESKSGNEGEVFFVNDNVVIKKYFSKIDNAAVLNGVFDKYCKECEQYHLKGYDIPQIYAWTMISKSDHSGFHYYIMEQRVPGRELFISNIFKMYDQYKDYISSKNFHDVLKNPELDANLYKKILTDYVSDFIEINQKIESMSDANLERFLEGVYGMFKEYHYAIPDVHARNVLLYNNNLKLIDLYFEKDEKGVDILKMTPPESLLYARLVMLFNYNADVKKLRAKGADIPNLIDDIDLNEVLCAEAMRKLIRVCKKLCILRPKENWWAGFVARLEKILDKENVEKVIKEVDPKFL